jgi:hypothetical protein
MVAEDANKPKLVLSLEEQAQLSNAAIDMLSARLDQLQALVDGKGSVQHGQATKAAEDRFREVSAKLEHEHGAVGCRLGRIGAGVSTEWKFDCETKQ